MDDPGRNLQTTLQEIERLMAAAELNGSSIPAWFAELATELRAAAPAGGDLPPDLANRILSDPRLSLGAQANLRPGAMEFLKG